jgi:hypothetical protein
LAQKSFFFNVKGTKNVFLQVGLNVTGDIAVELSMVEVYYEVEGGEFIKSTEKILTTVNLIPDRFNLSQNFPNPFNPSTTISFDLPEDVSVRIDIFDVSGRRIRTLLNEPKVAGSFQVVWNGNDDNGNLVASGLYVYRIHTGNFVQSKKMLFMK